MKNTFGTSMAVTLFGESHGPAVGAVLDGLAPGLPVEEEFIAAQLSASPWMKSIGAVSRSKENSGARTAESSFPPVLFGDSRPSVSEYAGYIPIPHWTLQGILSISSIG